MKRRRGRERKEKRGSRERERRQAGKGEGINSGGCLYSPGSLPRGVFRLHIPSGIESSPKKTH